MSVYVHLMPGRFDEDLTWPFPGEVRVTLKRKSSMVAQDYVKIIRFSNKTEKWVGERVADLDQSKNGWGDPAFILHDNLDKYLENDTINFIVEVSLEPYKD